MKVISVLSGNQVALWDRDPRHPGGEVFVVGERVVEVALTPPVQKALKQGRIVEVAEEHALHKNATVDEVLAAVEAGDVTAAEALAWEEARAKPRVTLVEALRGLIDGPDAGDSDDVQEPEDGGVVTDEPAG